MFYAVLKENEKWKVYENKTNLFDICWVVQSKVVGNKSEHSVSGSCNQPILEAEIRGGRNENDKVKEIQMIIWKKSKW